ncbi:unnamed protein product [Caenorhabditis auriculariae]|uniref:Uncharacterized protein n=1 Tax=Caenorhabditis auriculariae TaxID=2777116 RepID=A0A8S1H578_9PELO|nr:unnamed protein product [Caenorhabditis auriculariae]
MERVGILSGGFFHHNHHNDVHAHDSGDHLKPPVTLRTMSKSDPHLEIPHLIFSQDEDHPSLNKIMSSLMHVHEGLRTPVASQPNLQALHQQHELKDTVSRNARNLNIRVPINMPLGSVWRFQTETKYHGLLFSSPGLLPYIGSILCQLQLGFSLRINFHVPWAASGNSLSNGSQTEDMRRNALAGPVAQKSVRSRYVIGLKQPHILSQINIISVDRYLIWPATVQRPMISSFFSEQAFQFDSWS